MNASIDSQSAGAVSRDERSKLLEAWKRIGGGPLLLSLTLHAAALLIAGLVVWTQVSKVPPVDFLPAGQSRQGEQASQDLAYKIEKRHQSAMVKELKQRKLAVHGGDAWITLDDIPVEDIAMPDHEKGFIRVGSSGLGADAGSGNQGRVPGMNGTGPTTNVAMPALMGGRCGSAERRKNLNENGGNVQGEVAVSRSLEWLKAHQNADGSWGTQHKAAMTGLVLLSYLGRCETPDSPFYGDNVMKALLYLIETAKKNEHGIFAENPSDHAATYEHGIATYALGEVYAMARLGTQSLPGMKAAFESGVRTILAAQLADGGWGYGDGGDTCYRLTGNGDLSVTGWQYQALKAAKNTGLKIDGLHAGIAKAVAYLEQQQTKDGGFGVTSRDAGYNQWNLTGCGLLGLQTLGKGKAKAINEGVHFLNEVLTTEPLDWNKNCNLYCWYYLTQAYFQKGGEDWRRYNEQFLPQVLNNQAADGSWNGERANSQIGSTAPAGSDRAVYRQVLCTLMLEVYYRYLKVGDREGDSFFDR